MKHYKYIGIFLAVISMAALRPAGLFAETSALPVPAPVQNSSVSAPLNTSSAANLKVIAQGVNGEVSVKRSGKNDFETLAEKSELSQGDVVKTGEGVCYLIIGGKSQIYLEANTILSISEALKNDSTKSESTKLSLQGGRLKISLPNLKSGSSFEVTTPTAVATVRGTTFYLLVDKIADKFMSQLYVDKSDGGVFFKNLFSGEGVLVPHHSTSNSGQDGQLDQPKQLTPEEQKKFLEQWEGSGGASGQFGIEEIPLNGSLPPADLSALAGHLEKIGLSDALIDKLLEQNIAGQNLELNQLTPPLGGATPKEPGDEETPPTDEENPPTEEPGGETGDPSGITDEEKSMVVEVVNDLLAEQSFDATDAGLAQVEDAQTGKVMTDVHGNRVRVDQYITQTAPNAVGFLSLTLREGAYQNGLTSLYFSTTFNRDLTEADGPFRDLPWNNYLNVVTNEEMTGLNVGGQFGQYIVHESYQIPDGFDPGPDLFPEVMLLMMMSPIQENQDFGGGLIIFSESFDPPFRATSEQGEFWLQGRASDDLIIFHASGESIFSHNDATQPSLTVFNAVETFVVDNLDRAQSAGFSSSAGLSDLDTLDGINFFRDNAVHPASFENQFGDTRTLIGYFLPIDDAGQVFDAPGFRLRSLRDVVHPNSLVNGGNYNLELLFVYGELTDGALTSEIFRIDAIVTPEIFHGSPESGPGFGLKGVTGELVTDTTFPDTLEEDQQNV